jgi:tetratricopeptide (TPR) repeat protein
MIDQNWYTQDISPRPPKRTSYVWVWLLGGCVVFFGLIATAVTFVVSQIPPGKEFGEWLAESASTDDSQVIEFGNSAAAERLKSAKAAYAENRVAAEDASPKEVVAVESFLRELTTIIQSGENTAFEAKTSILEFKDRVRKAPSLSFTARREFRSQFDDWFTMYCPYTASVSRIQLVSVKRDPADHTLIAYTWVFNSEYPDRVAWYLRSNGQEMRIVDFELLDASALESDDTARQFSAAFTGQAWDNYLAIQEDLISDATSDEEIKKAKAEVLRLSGLRFPKSLQHAAYHRLAQLANALDDKDLCLQMLAKTEELAPLPSVYWLRTIVFRDLKDFAKAESNLRQYMDLIGPGPECFMLEAEIATAQKQREKANVAWGRLLAMDPDNYSLPWGFHGYMPAASVVLLAKSIESRPDSAIAAQKIANLFVSRDRIDLAEPLLPIAESGNEPTPELFALRAEISKLSGDTDGYVRNLELAWKAATPEHSTRSTWLYGWANEMLTAGKGAEAIALSPDPGRTFYDLAMDEDGCLILTSKQLQELSDALQNALTDDESAGKWLKIWQRLAPVTVMIQRADNQTAWDSLSTLMAKEASAGDKLVTELLTELELTWTVREWLTTAAIRTNHAAEVWDLMPEEDRLSNLLWKIDDAQVSDSLTTIVGKLRTENPANPDIIFCEALAADLKKDIPTAIRKYHEFMQQPGFEESPFQYRVTNSLVDIAVNQSDWKPTIAVLAANSLLGTLASRLVEENRLDDAQAVVDMAQQRGATLAETVDAEAEILRARKDWPALCSLGDRWLAERKPEENTGATAFFRPSDAMEAFIDGWIATRQFDRAEQYVTSLSDGQYHAAKWKLRIAVARNDQTAAEAVFSDAETNSGAAPGIAALGENANAIWTEEWREFRRRHPISLHNVSNMNSGNEIAVVLQSAATPITSGTLQAALRTLQDNVTVEDLTSLLTQTEQQMMASLLTSKQRPKNVAEFVSGTRQLFRARLDGSTFLLYFGTDQYHKPAGTAVDSDDTSTQDGEALPEPLKQAIDDHQTWICLYSEARTTASDAADAEPLFAKIVAALLNDSTTVVSIASETAPMSAALQTALAGGTTDDLPSAVSYTIPGAEPLNAAMSTTSETRLRALRKRLSEFPDGAELPKIRLLLSMPGLWRRDQLAIECSLIRWEPPAHPATFTVDLGDSPLVPPTFRGEYAETDAGGILDWREE